MAEKHHKRRLKPSREKIKKANRRRKAIARRVRIIPPPAINPLLEALALGVATFLLEKWGIKARRPAAPVADDHQLQDGKTIDIKPEWVN